MANDDSSPAQKPKRLRDSASEYAKQKAYQVAYRAANKAKIAEYNRAYFSANSEKKIAASRAYHAANRDAVLERRRAALTDADRAAASARAVAWQRANQDRVNANHRAYGKANPHIGRAKTANRNAAMRMRVPSWFGELDALVMIEASEVAATRTLLTGVAWDVDHLLPMRGRTVSGLHVWNNIQVIPATLNRSKGNRFVPEMLA